MLKRIFDKNISKIAAAAEAGRIFSPGAIFCEYLKPTEYKELELIKVKLQERLIVVYEFHIKYFRETDMREFDRTESYFIDGYNLVKHADFLQRNPWDREYQTCFLHVL